jgi:hypothetical protein
MTMKQECPRYSAKDWVCFKVLNLAFKLHSDQ